ncbi:AAA domain-containing protein [Boletus edulis BED1]|uniref:AAA domain-containing protein n=1 Tax=Boletus edulis BED1 TaxID=1328754 RepID=A0AAD4BCE1_BOLED|nr:AAA domain-containing protein [Boletus edulis BED1]
MSPEKVWMTAEFADTPDKAEPAKAPTVLPEPSFPPVAEPYPSYVNDAAGFFTALGQDDVPAVPFGNRALETLLEEPEVWEMSQYERQTLHAFWIEEARMHMQRNQQDEFDRLRKKHADKVREYIEIKEEDRRVLLKNVKIIGCTTAGAAKLGTLRSLSPKVQMVEEAGQVLEAHVLGSLVPPVQHLILIGDPLQLRPTLNNFATDAPKDIEPNKMHRNTLYKGLQDHELVKKYLDVRGMVKNMFFIIHNHKENGGTDDTASKYNVYEGCPGGQVAVVIDGRDQAALDDREGDKEDAGGAFLREAIQHVKARLRTVDNYQGEEGKIIILSLVRNVGGDDDDLEKQMISQHTRVNIGFLKSENRTNVALSRAREGLYIFGNAESLSAKSRMWRTIIEELDAQDALSPASPVACHRYPDTVEYVSFPGQLCRIAPDGGCMEQCDTLLKCRHLCPFKVSVPCYQLDMLESVRCNEEVEKQLSDCFSREALDSLLAGIRELRWEDVMNSELC